MSGDVLALLIERARWYRDGCDGLEDVDEYYASGDCARDAASDLESAIAEITRLRAGAVPQPSRLEIEVETLRTLLAAWQKRCYEAERTQPHGEMVDQSRLQPFIDHMRDVVVPEIVEAVAVRQRRAAETRDLPLGAVPQQEPQEWQPIETAPKDEQRVLLLNPGEEMSDWAVQVGAYYEQLGGWQYDGQNPRYSNAHQPTRWMPLPAVPALPAPQEQDQ